MHELEDLYQLLATAIIDNPPVLIRDGGVIAEGFDDDLDELRNLSHQATEKLLQMENKEKANTHLSMKQPGLIFVSVSIQKEGVNNDRNGFK